MSKVKFISYSIFLALAICITTCMMSLSVHAETFTGEPPYLKLKPFSISIVPDPSTAPNFGYTSSISFSCENYSVYQIFTTYPFPSIAPERTQDSVVFFACNIGSAPVCYMSSNVNTSVNPTRFVYTHNGVQYECYYAIYYANYMTGVDVRDEYGELKKLDYKQKILQSPEYVQEQ